MGALNAQFIHDAVVLRVVRVQLQLLARVVRDDPALGRVRAAVNRVVDTRQEGRDEGAVARTGLVIDRSGLEREAGLGEHGLLLRAVQRAVRHVGDAAAGHIVDHGRARRGGAEGDDRAAAVVSPKPVVDLEPVRLGRIDTGRMHAALVDRRQESGHHLREVVSSASRVHIVRAVDADRVALVGRDRHRGQVHTLAQHRHLDGAPADALVLVVLAGTLLEPQHVLLARRGLAAVVQEAVPADVARLLQHTVLLLSCQRVETRALHRLRCVAPVQAAVLVIGAFDQQGQHALGGVCGIELDEDLAVEHVVAQGLRDDALLGQGQILEARLRARSQLGRRSDATPVDEFQAEVRRGARGCLRHQACGCRGVGAVPHAALVDLIAQRLGDDLFLRQGQGPERGPRRRRSCRAPVHVGVLVVRQRSLAEGGARDIARGGVEIEEVLWQRNGAGRRARIAVVIETRLARPVQVSRDDPTLSRCQVLPTGVQRRTQLAHDNIPLAGSEVGIGKLRHAGLLDACFVRVQGEGEGRSGLSGGQIRAHAQQLAVGLGRDLGRDKGLGIDRVGQAKRHRGPRGSLVGPDVGGLHRHRHARAVDRDGQRGTYGVLAGQHQAIDLHGRELDPAVDHGALCFCQRSVRGARQRPRHRTPLGGRQRVAEVDGRGVDPGLQRDLRVIERRARPGVQRDDRMVEHIAQAAGHHHLLGPGQAVEGGVGGGRRHACGLPVDRGVAVVRPLTLDETGAQFDGLDLVQQGLALDRVGFLRQQGP